MNYVNEAITYIKCWISVKLTALAVNVASAVVEYDPKIDRRNDHPGYIKQKEEFAAWNKRQLEIAGKLNTMAKDILK